MSDSDNSPEELALAVDAVIDALGEAIDQGDMESASALADAADATSDALLESMGIASEDPPDDGAA